MLLRLTRDNLAHTAQLSPDVVRFAETRTHQTDQAAILALARLLEARGVVFEAPGLVRHVDGRLALTRRAVGRLKGERIRRARSAMGMTLCDLAMDARIGVGTVQRLEESGELRATAAVYAAMGALQLAGYRFAPNHGDKRVGERCKPLAPWEKDLPIEWLGVGLHVGISELEDLGLD